MYFGKIESYNVNFLLFQVLNMANPGSTEENQIAASRELNVSLNSEAAMDEFLNGLNLYRKPVAKDGSCLFRAVSEHVRLLVYT